MSEEITKAEADTIAIWHSTMILMLKKRRKECKEQGLPDITIDEFLAEAEEAILHLRDNQEFPYE